MNPPARLGDWHPLDTVHAALKLQATVCALARDLDNGLFESADVVLARRQHLDLPPTRLRVTQIHALEVGGEERGLVAAGPRPDLHDDVALIVRVARAKQLEQPCAQLLAALLEATDLLLGERTELQIWLVQQGPVVLDFALHVDQALAALDYGRERRLLAAEALQAARVGQHFRTRHKGRDLVHSGPRFLDPRPHPVGHSRDCLRHGRAPFADAAIRCTASSTGSVSGAFCSMSRRETVAAFSSSSPTRAVQRAPAASAFRSRARTGRLPTPSSVGTSRS